VSITLATFFIDRSVEFDQTHWIPQTEAEVGGCACGVKFYDRDDLYAHECSSEPEERDVGLIELDADGAWAVFVDGQSEPLAVTTSLEAAYAARRLLR
jgi:hypothetical protein